MKHETIAILDFGSQYVQLIARRVREHNVYSRICRAETPAEQLRRLGIKGLILSGGPASVYDENAPKCDEKIFELGVPVLGICYGMQLGCQTLGAKIVPAKRREYGRTNLSILDKSDLFANLPETFPSQLSHCDVVTELPPGAESLAHSSQTQHQAYRIGENIRCVQFHPEFNVDVMKFVIRKHRGTLVAEGFDLKKLAASLRETPAAATVPVNFEKYFVQSENP